MGRPSTAWRHVVPPVALLAVVLGLTITRYGYHRDELYFRLLPLRWGYVDQPPLIPGLVRVVTAVSDSVWALRLPAVLLACAAVLVLVLVAAELGGGPRAQAITAWGTAFATFTLSFGHLLLTASVDLLLWPAILLAVIKVTVRERPRWWLAAGLLVGVGTYGKWLIASLVLAVLVGLVVLGPRSALRSRWLAAGAGLAVVVALPNIAWQLGHGVPQAAMGAALSERNGTDVRTSLGPLLLIMIGPLLCWVWIAAFVTLWRRPRWRPVRFLPLTVLVIIALTAVGGSQVYYPVPALATLFAAGAVVIEDLAGRHRRPMLAAVALHVVTNVVINLPVLPLSALRQTPIPAMNQTIGDSVGWPTYVAQVDAVVAPALAADPSTVVITTNYGEAGALDRFGTTAAPVFSGHNALGALGPPPTGTTTVVVVGDQLDLVATLVPGCRPVATLDNGVGIENEEQGDPVGLCRTGPLDWERLWPQLEHLG